MHGCGGSVSSLGQMPCCCVLGGCYHIEKPYGFGFVGMAALAGADPEENLTRAQPKVRGCGYMGVALSMGSYRHDLVDAAQLSA